MRNIIEVKASKYLPRTVKDKDGNEVELIGIVTPDQWAYDRWMMDLSDEVPPPQIVMLTGKVVKPATEARP